MRFMRVLTRLEGMLGVEGDRRQRASFALVYFGVLQ